MDMTLKEFLINAIDDLSKSGIKSGSINFVIGVHTCDGYIKIDEKSPTTISFTINIEDVFIKDNQ